jgi:hypothetical protein
MRLEEHCAGASGEERRADQGGPGWESRGVGGNRWLAGGLTAALGLAWQVTCETIKKWLTKNSAESENMNWILANTKPCPKCSRPIEKNQVGL